MTETVRVSLASWLLEQIADEEAVAHEAARQAFFDATEGQPQVNYEVWPFGKIAVNRDTYTDIATCVLSPARVLAECAARRKIIEEHATIRSAYPGTTIESDPCCRCCSAGGEYPGQYPCRTLRLLALPYADQPGYRAEWAVSP